MLNWKLKLYPLAVCAMANARKCVVNSLMCGREWVLRCSVCLVCVMCMGVVFFCLRFAYTLGDVAHINLFIYFLFTTFFSSRVHSIFAASFSMCVCVCVCVQTFCMRCASTSIAQKSSERYWRAREHVFVCILKQCWCIFCIPVCVCVMMWWCEAPLI